MFSSGGRRSIVQLFAAAFLAAGGASAGPCLPGSGPGSPLPIGGGSGAFLVNDNGLKAPFPADQCYPNPIIHAYTCGAKTRIFRDYDGPQRLHLGSGLCVCKSLAGCISTCTSQPVGEPISVCGGDTTTLPNCVQDDSLDVAVVGTSPTPPYHPIVELRMCYVSAGATSPFLLVRLARGEELVLERKLDDLPSNAACVPGQSLVSFSLPLAPGEYGFQLTVAEPGCLQPLAPEFEIYEGGETENGMLYVVAVPGGYAALVSYLPATR